LTCNTSTAGRKAPMTAHPLKVVLTPSGLINHPLADGTLGSYPLSDMFKVSTVTLSFSKTDRPTIKIMAMDMPKSLTTIRICKRVIVYR